MYGGLFFLKIFSTTQGVPQKSNTYIHTEYSAILLFPDYREVT